jgi:NAD(P)-dependent dehydrogenase (short-subunit alcohol dehydrogenase family)
MARPGLRMVLVGRTAEPQPEDAATAAARELPVLKQLLLAQARARGEMPKPVDIDRAAARVMTDREIRANLARLRATGAVVDYQACDVRDPASFGAVIDGLYARHGRIDAVLHGAGVIEDRRIADKTEESFGRVFGTKLDSSFILMQKLQPQTLKLLVFFTSVAGRYGNRGQVDYAAANEAVNRLAWSLSRRWTKTRVIGANWGPWDAGMASEAVKAQLREKGMEPIPVPGGRRYFLRELACGPRHEVEIVIGRGPWGDLDPPAEAAPPVPRTPLRIGPGGALLMDLKLDAGAQAGPAMATEWIAQIAAQGWPGWQIGQIQELRALGDTPASTGVAEIEVRARATSHSGPGEQSVVVEIGGPQQRPPLYKATVQLVTTAATDGRGRTGTDAA